MTLFRIDINDPPKQELHNQQNCIRDFECKQVAFSKSRHT